ncbi:Transcription initiation factor TFIID subunit 6 isoform 1 [Schistosoma japonicum]|uniref:Transcription initiation factor TFIID subunit 6 isoform 1 n=2 Tax=Schistosoma japonicum TaxID=6182 RepID=A0A4Z2DBY8_SCHJA|nr:Transcription initiation factor TFIID subunit 6 [Schistosoma japonicum]KAH8867981.1 Transcription initiation factor TFIID subunit 6 [Schistosoma japonicum]KAH8867982.1 Transcription initiation factor TFIID subunit 6 [Schistosoma japonicum]KAH8867983.1 Transcription initiation factor TFIID subunit 6 [Schistosoma japonicum]KAH8867984.1 Transcription initiation factor TFIID subunit 6 [Schistosoma japonicum]
MDSAEKRRLNKLLRKPSSSSLGKALGLRQKLSRNSQKQAKCASGVSEKGPKQEINVDVATLCAEMCGVSNLSQPAANLLQKHLNQIARLLIHEVLRVMEQSRRGVPQASDIDLASVLIGLESPFGTTTANFLPIRTGGRTASSGPGGKVFFIRPDKEIDVKALLLREPAGVVYDVSLVAHWLSVNGKQPTSPQNPPPDFLARMALLNNSFGSNKPNKRSLVSSDKKNDNVHSSVEKYSKTCLHSSNRERFDTLSSLSASSHPRKVLAVSVERRCHEISQEVMIYFRELTEACVGANETRRHEALDNATLDPGLQPILPHLMTFITEGVRINVTNHNLAILIYLMRLVKALIDNPHISLEPYLHLLVPTIITCVLNRQLCAKPITDNHWALRDFAAKQLATLCNRHNTSSNELYSRVTRELSRALCSWIDGNTSNNSTESCIKLSNLNLPIVVKSEFTKSFDDDDEVKFRKYESDRSVNSAITSTTTSVTTIINSSSNNNSNNNNGPNLGSAVHSMNTLYGILVALAEFGAQCLRMMVFPLLSSLCHRLTKLTEPNLSSVNEINELINTSGTNDLKPTQQHPVLSLSLGAKLSPVDQRSFDFLKIMMTNRIAPLLHDWRIRQGFGITLDDYQASYECMAECLFVMNQNNNISSNNAITTTATITPSQLIINNPVHHPPTSGNVNVLINSSASVNNSTTTTTTSNNSISHTTSTIVTSNITASNMNNSSN